MATIVCVTDGLRTTWLTSVFSVFEWSDSLKKYYKKKIYVSLDPILFSYVTVNTGTFQVLSQLRFS